MSVLSEPHFHNKDAARARLEKLLWPNGPVCPRCKGMDRLTVVKGARDGVRRCGPCKREFTVTVGTIFERSHVPLNLWFQAAHLMASSKKGMSAHQLHRTLKVTYKTAWFMEHRLREAMREGALAPMGGLGGIVEADETYLGKMDGVPRKTIVGGRSGFRNAVLPLVERGGSARSFHIDGARTSIILPIVAANVARETRLMTDQASWYAEIGADYEAHETVNHTRAEYVRGQIHTNTVEGYYSIFKRGMKGVYQHCSEKHLHRYLAEFDFRYSNRVRLGVDDIARTGKLLRGAAGKRLTYRDSSARPAFIPW